eukprot:snap_masked-scaffold_13-processed-gene-11.27-mRNA-1 protein AED:1.00 eAED:1.00 QI:0/0/0/0/1/1/2/0/113
MTLFVENESFRTSSCQNRVIESFNKKQNLNYRERLKAQPLERKKRTSSNSKAGVIDSYCEILKVIPGDDSAVSLDVDSREQQRKKIDNIFIFVRPYKIVSRKDEIDLIWKQNI